MPRVDYDKDYYCKACEHAFPQDDALTWPSGRKVCPLCGKHAARTSPLNRKVKEVARQ